jgi:hypothetical protein
VIFFLAMSSAKAAISGKYFCLTDIALWLPQLLERLLHITVSIGTDKELLIRRYKLYLVNPLLMIAAFRRVERCIVK